MSTTFHMIDCKSTTGGTAADCHCAERLADFQKNIASDPQVHIAALTAELTKARQERDEAVAQVMVMAKTAEALALRSYTDSDGKGWECRLCGEHSRVETGPFPHSVACPLSNLPTAARELMEMMKRYRKALLFYAHAGSWQSDVLPSKGTFIDVPGTSPASQDMGSVARAALEGK